MEDMIKTQREIALMREGGKMLAVIMGDLLREVKPGVSTNFLDEQAELKIRKAGAVPAFQGYEGFPKTLCASVNEEIVHVIPSKRILKEGDIVTLDLGLIWEGRYLDMARTVPVGKASKEALALIQVTQRSLDLGIEQARPGKTLGDIGSAVQKYVESKGYGVVRDLCGHGIGKQLHEEPKVLNYGEQGKGLVLKEGMVICIEPMVTEGDWHLKKASDGYGFQTKDGSLSCHFEDTIVITSKGPEVLTKS
ncbi:MAG: type I methionyl aminopeptidase [bacterium]|nr:type I methionyl aminopeptidase [bacterium]